MRISKQELKEYELRILRAWLNCCVILFFMCGFMFVYGLCQNDVLTKYFAVFIAGYNLNFGLYLLFQYNREKNV